MRNLAWLALLPMLLFGAGACTMPNHPKALAWVEQMRASAVLDPNAVILETALIERPVGDAFINEELWGYADELIVDLERRAALEENGLRVGQLVGTPPAGFQALLLSERSCSNPSRLTVPAGKTIPQYLGPVLPHGKFEHVRDETPTVFAADQVRFGLDVTANLTSDGRTKLTLTPKVETGELLLPFEAAPEESSWVLRIERPSKKYPDLSWEVTLAPGQYLIVGGRLDLPERYGHCAFVQEDEPAVQRLLVIRTTRAAPAGIADPDELSDLSPPLALQAAKPAFRAKGQ